MQLHYTLSKVSFSAVSQANKIYILMQDTQHYQTNAICLFFFSHHPSDIIHRVHSMWKRMLETPQRKTITKTESWIGLIKAPLLSVLKQQIFPCCGWRHLSLQI